ncbi:transcriptional repressor [Mycobacterium phage BTCU-1]|uniref:Repressor n=1 Tax=Mycobacterium phage BTCU-1 TaxID=1262532 RepID=R9R4E7_9CAUD|nr:transcriptional repressor [Mycobacterium phage BTCU-1]AGI61752.1 repressor [Mycobacterium phage BTCU-1]
MASHNEVLGRIDLSTRKVTDNIIRVFAKASEQDILDGKVWYEEAKALAVECAVNGGMTLEQSAVMIAQLSPRLREHGEYMATGGVGMDELKLSRLRGFYKKLRDQVLEYDPNIPPIEGVSRQGGWAYRPRKPEDGDLLIRVNDYTDLTDEGRMIWRFPPREP